MKLPLLGAGRLSKGPKPELMSEGLDQGTTSQICALHAPIAKPGRDAQPLQVRRCFLLHCSQHCIMQFTTLSV